MECSTRNGQALAAADALTVAETDLQRIKQQGCGTSRQDRSIMQLPDLKAFTYPIPTNVPVEVASGANNKYLGRSSVNAEGFVPPFVNAPLEEGSTVTASNLAQKVNSVSSGNNAVPGLEFAGTGEIAQLDKVMFGNPPVLYKQIAASIQGEPVRSEEAAAATPRMMRDPETPLGRAGVVGIDEVESAKQLQRRLYGASKVPVADTFVSRCKAAVLGVLYDLLHYEEAAKAYGGSVDSFGGAVQSVCTRDGRSPYLLFVFIALILGCLVLYTGFSATAPPPAQMPTYYSCGYTMPGTAPTALAPLMGFPFPQ